VLHLFYSIAAELALIGCETDMSTVFLASLNDPYYIIYVL